MTKESLSSGSLQPPGPRRPLRDESSPGLELGSPLGSLVGHFQGSGHSHPSPSPCCHPRSRHAPHAGPRGRAGPRPQPLAAAAPRLRSALRPLAPAARARGRARLPASPPAAASVPPAPLGARRPQSKLLVSIRIESEQVPVSSIYCLLLLSHSLAHTNTDSVVDTWSVSDDE